MPKLNHEEGRALGWLAIAAVAIVVWLAWPFMISLLLGALAAFTLEPLDARLEARTRRPRLSAALVVIVTGAAVLAAASGFVTLFVTQLVALTSTVSDSLRPGGGLASSADTATRWLARHGVPTASVTQRLESAAGEIASKSAAIAAALAAGTFSALLGLFFALLAMYVVLRHWPRLVEGVLRVSPLHPKHTRAVLEEFRCAGRATLSGTVVTGLAQGAFAAVGYWLSGISPWAFFGVATAVASLVPAVGTLLVWVPIGVFLIATGHATRGVLELSWCAGTVVAVCDYVIRPRLVGDENTPTILVFIALFGGLELFGLWGLVVGPILMSLAVATVRLYARETRGEGERPAPRAVMK